jgi:hypothetical protein
MKTLITALIVSKIALAGWYCTEVASEKKGNSIYACGIGTAVNEDKARTEAFKSAEAEFQNICQASEDCRGKAYNTDPLRTECVTNKDNVTCHRLLVFTPTDKKSLSTSYNPDQVSVKKVKKGMSIKEVMSILGKPSSIVESNVWPCHGTCVNMFYSDCGESFCEKYPGSARIYFQNNKMVDSSRIDADYLEF